MNLNHIYKSKNLGEKIQLLAGYLDQLDHQVEEVVEVSEVLLVHLE